MPRDARASAACDIFEYNFTQKAVFGVMYHWYYCILCRPPGVENYEPLATKNTEE